MRATYITDEEKQIFKKEDYNMNSKNAWCKKLVSFFGIFLDLPIHFYAPKLWLGLDHVNKATEPSKHIPHETAIKIYN